MRPRYSKSLLYAFGGALITRTDPRRRLLNTYFPATIVNNGISGRWKDRMQTPVALSVLQKIKDLRWDQQVCACLVDAKSSTELFDELEKLIFVFVHERALQEKLLILIRAFGHSDGNEANERQAPQTAPQRPPTSASVGNQLTLQPAPKPAVVRHANVAPLALPATPHNKSGRSAFFGDENATPNAVVPPVQAARLVLNQPTSTPLTAVRPNKRDELDSGSKIYKEVSCQTTTPSKQPNPVVKLYREMMCQTDEAPKEEAKRYHEVGAQTVQTASTSQTHVFECQREPTVDTQDSGLFNRHSDNRKRNLDSRDVEVTISAPKCARVAVVLNRNDDN